MSSFASTLYTMFGIRKFYKYNKEDKKSPFLGYEEGKAFRLEEAKEPEDRRNASSEKTRKKFICAWKIAMAHRHFYFPGVLNVWITRSSLPLPCSTLWIPKYTTTFLTYRYLGAIKVRFEIILCSVMSTRNIPVCAVSSMLF